MSTSAAASNTSKGQPNSQKKSQQKKKQTQQQHDPVLEHRIAETKRLEELVRTPIRAVPEEYIETIKEIREVTSTQLSNEEILEELQSKNFDVNAVVISLSDAIADNANAGWMSAKGKRSKKSDTPPSQPPQQHQQVQYLTKHKQVTSPPISSVVTTAPVLARTAPASEDLMLEMGRTLSQQLAEVEQHAKLLLELKTEYDSVLSHTNQDIANLSSRKLKLQHEKGELERQVLSITQQIEEVSIKIASMEKEHVEKLRVLKEKSQLVIPSLAQR